MPWPTWQQSLVAASLSAVLSLLLRSTNPAGVRRVSSTGPTLGPAGATTLTGRLVIDLTAAATEFAILAGLYSMWRMAAKLPLYQTADARQRAYDIVELQQGLGWPGELGLQEFVMRWDSVSWFTSAYYTAVHVPATIAFLVWVFVRHRHGFGQWRNVLAMTTAACLVIRFWRVAPPRFLTDLGFVDLPARFGLSPYGPVGTGVSPQFAAMPSIHVAWAAVASFAIVALSSRWWRLLGVGHLTLTMIVVVATGHHWWLDGVVAVIIVAAAWTIDQTVRKRLGQVRSGGGGSAQTSSRTGSNLVGASSPSIAAKA